MHGMLDQPATRAQFALYPPGGEAVFYPGGRVPPAGALFVQPALAGTLERLVEAGAGDRLAGIAAARRRFYAGDIAAAVGAFSERLGGLLRASDLGGYRATLEPPLGITFAGREILTQSAWTQAPVLLQALGMLAAFDLRAMGHNSPRYIHVVTEALKLAFADRERHYGDSATVPLAGLLAPGYLRGRAALIRLERAAPAAPAPGDPDRRGLATGAPPAARVADAAAAAGTTHIPAIDRDGNMICLTPSGGVFRKSAFAPELGCTLSTRSEMFVLEEGHPNALAPGKRPRTTLVSYLIVENGEPTVTIGCPGGDDQAQADLQLVLNVLVFGMNPQRAAEAPRFSTQTLVNSFYPRAYRPGLLDVERGISESARAAPPELGPERTQILPARPGLPGTGDVERRVRRHPRQARRQGDARRGAGPRSRHRGGGGPSRLCRSREGIRRRAVGGRRDHPPGGGSRARRRLDRGRDRGQGQAAVRHRAGDRTCGGGRESGA